MGVGRFAVCAALMAGAALAQEDIAGRPAVKQALDFIARNEAAQVDLQVKIAEIPAPGFHEERRAAFVASEFRRLNLENVEIDGVGNVLGLRRGDLPRMLVVAAHLDTVFPEGTDVKVNKVGDRLNGPGLVDDSRGLTDILSLADALDRFHIRTHHTLLFVADVGEEGLGSLRGIKYLVNEGKYRGRMDAFVSIDGDGQNTIFDREVGSRRYRVTITGPGGHSYLNFGRVNPADALGRIIALLSNMDVPSSPKTTYNVGRLGGGTSVNSIPFDAWFEFDMRSESEEELIRLEQRFLKLVQQGMEEENRFRAGSGTELKLDAKQLAVRHAIADEKNSSLVNAAVWASHTLGMGAPQQKGGSTDSNAAASAGIPAMTMDGGGGAGSLHSPEEWFKPAGSSKGIEKLLLTVLRWDETQR